VALACTVSVIECKPRKIASQDAGRAFAVPVSWDLNAFEGNFKPPMLHGAQSAANPAQSRCLQRHPVPAGSLQIVDFGAVELNEQFLGGRGDRETLCPKQHCLVESLLMESPLSWLQHARLLQRTRQRTIDNDRSEHTLLKRETTT
jgi:hypothetical protein